MTGFDIRLGAPPLADYLRLRGQTVWPPVAEATARAALAGAQFAITAREAGAVIGFLRVVGDGATVFYVEDLIVDQAARGRGLGRALLAAAGDEIQCRARDGAMIALLAAAGTEPFYAAAGFTARPGPGYGAAMMRILGERVDE